MNLKDIYDAIRSASGSHYQVRRNQRDCGSNDVNSFLNGSAEPAPFSTAPAQQHSETSLVSNLKRKAQAPPWPVEGQSGLRINEPSNLHDARPHGDEECKRAVIAIKDRAIDSVAKEKGSQGT